MDRDTQTHRKGKRHADTQKGKEIRRHTEREKRDKERKVKDRDTQTHRKGKRHTDTMRRKRETQIHVDGDGGAAKLHEKTDD